MHVAWLVLLSSRLIWLTSCPLRARSVPLSLYYYDTQHPVQHSVVQPNRGGFAFSRSRLRCSFASGVISRVAYSETIAASDLSRSYPKLTPEPL